MSFTSRSLSKQIDECQGVRTSVRSASKDLFTLGEGQGEQDENINMALVSHLQLVRYEDCQER